MLLQAVQQQDLLKDGLTQMRSSKSSIFKVRSVENTSDVLQFNFFPKQDQRRTQYSKREAGCVGSSSKCSDQSNEKQKKLKEKVNF